ncbi:hypothetical protein CA233_09655 [Sphingomonas sp. ABOLD]|uniref:Uncharacterized protein n=1 Tax=Sphingomonas trueperi TaxID=53317 RepID=A0A7X6BEV0_9SPHN|nr:MULTISPECIES: hypothetical protein [Sphingomonas]NJB99316.1 hypothetical protein [Sphingomonas trueperi]RSV40674.1 hypothetical protein CA234_11240 [Sphingomonas sp. ABOLE]RSV48562.1 hypothetical protein CA233_09655 [Sphingomonas sp. ABOLD]
MIGMLIALAGAAMPVQDGTDVFIGTVELDGTALILRRCDLAENRYALAEAPGGHVLDTLRKAGLPAYGEVIGRYVEGKDGGSILQVEHVEALTPGKTCHLSDALGG